MKEVQSIGKELAWLDANIYNHFIRLARHLNQNCMNRWKRSWATADIRKALTNQVVSHYDLGEIAHPII